MATSEPAPLRKAFRRGLWPGLILFAALYAAGAASLTSFTASPDADTARIIDGFKAQIALTLFRVLLAHGWTGLVLGGLCGLLMGMLYPRMLGHRLPFVASTFGLLAAVSTYLAARLLIRQPTFFDQFLLAQGGPGFRLQVLLTDQLGLRSLDAMAALLFAALLLCSASFRSLFHRRRPLRRAQVLFWLSVSTGVLTVTLRWLWSPPTPVRPDRPNILILSVDSMRPDHMSCHGYERPTTPAIDRLAAEGLVFENAFVPLARTLPSWTTLLTSSASHSHGIRQMFPGSDRRRIPLPTLAESLARHGYRSAVVSDFAGEMFDLIDYGFDRVDTPPASDVDVLIEREILLHFPHLFPFVNHRLGKRFLPVISYLTINSDADALARRALRRMRELSDTGPFFLTVFFSTPHAPYAAPDPYYRLFTDPDYRGPHRYAYGIRDPRQMREGNPELSPADRRQIVGLYDSSIAAVDHAIGEIVEELDRWGFLESTVIVVTADHGEHLFEGCNQLDHGKWFRNGDHANRIPLILFDRSGKLGSGRVESSVRSLDVMPTLLDRLALQIPGTCEGESLFPCILGERAWTDLPLFAETGIWLKAPTTFAGEEEPLIYPHINEMLDPDPRDATLALKPGLVDRVVTAKHRMAYVPPYRLVYETRETGARYQLFDAAVDPLGTHELGAERPEVLARLMDDLHAWMQQDSGRRLDRRRLLVPYFTTLTPYQSADRAIPTAKEPPQK